ncbi:MAG TPA: FG-GAP-like repeat-containing protein [Gaiellaceae bacterium]|nr:FG-GAP-like repeat-containing protein [Gaiellaceae bacterium]
MSAPAAPAPAGRTLTIRGTPYPVVLPKLSDPRLHLAAVITTLQVLGQTAFQFRVSIAQILISLLTCAVLEVAITFRKQHILMWPASAMLTGNGVAFILRVPGTRHGDWWSVRGWWIFMATAAVSLLSKYVIKWKVSHVFNPSNIGLVLCFLLLGRNRAEPLDFWWGPVSLWLLFAFLVIVSGGLFILSRLKLLWIAVSFWLSFAAGIAVLAATGHSMVARWHLGPITGPYFWWALLSSPEVLVFLFFMLTDPKTTPRGQRDRVVYAVSVGLLAALLIAPMTTEWATKVALLGALAIVCAARPLLALLPLTRLRLTGPRLAITAAAAAAIYAFSLVAVSGPAGSAAATGAVSAKGLPAITIEPSKGVESKLLMPTARAIVRDLVTTVHAAQGGSVRIHLEPGAGQDPPYAVAQLAGVTYRLHQDGARWKLGSRPTGPTFVKAPTPIGGVTLTDVAAQSGIEFSQGSFRYGMTNDPQAMMGGGLCWLDYNNDGWLDLFAVNGYTDNNLPAWETHGGLPTGHLYRNDHGQFTDVTKQSGVGLPLRGEGCVAADLNGDGYTDLFVTTSTNDLLFWNNGDGTFTEGARKAGVVSFGWHSGAAVADVNGDGRPDLFVAGYADTAHPIPGSVKGFPSNYPGVRDELFLNMGHAHFDEVGAEVGLDSPPYSHGLGAEFIHVNGKLMLFVANDEDPNELYEIDHTGPHGVQFIDVAKKLGVADRNAGMGVAAAPPGEGGYPDLFVSNSRRQVNAAYRGGAGTSFSYIGSTFTRALGGTFTGWGDSWVDLKNSGDLDLVLASGSIPVTNLAKNAGPIHVLTPVDDGYLPVSVVQKIRTNGRGVAAADYDNDGRIDLAVNTIGGKLLLLHNTTPSGNWLTVDVRPFSPGAIVTAVSSLGPNDLQVRDVTAGSSYLSSEDPRVHFGFGLYRPVRLIVRWPDGTVKQFTPPTNAIFVAQR